jgi:hypothetical protein
MTRPTTWRPYRDYLNARVSQHKRALPKTSGIYCADCRMAHSYNGPSRLGIDYSYHGDQLAILWLCPYTGETISEVSYGR